jgi:hypothetical protein
MIMSVEKVQMRVDTATKFTVPTVASVGIDTTIYDGMARYIHDKLCAVSLSLYFVVVARESYSLVKNEGRKMDEIGETVSSRARAEFPPGQFRCHVWLVPSLRGVPSRLLVLFHTSLQRAFCSTQTPKLRLWLEMLSPLRRHVLIL